MKYLKDKNSRRRGVAIELAIGMLLIMVAMSTIIVVTTMIQIEKQKNSVNNLDNLFTEIEIMEYDQVGLYFKEIVSNEIIELSSNKFSTPLDEYCRLRLIEAGMIFKDENGQEENPDSQMDQTLFDIKVKLQNKLNVRFAALMEKYKYVEDEEVKTLNFNVTVKFEETPISTINPEDEPAAIDLENSDEEDIIETKIETETVQIQYKFEFCLEVINPISGEDITVLTVKKTVNFDQIITIESTFEKEYDYVPVEKEITYNIQSELIELELKEGHILSFTGVDVGPNILLSAVSNLAPEEQEYEVYDYFIIETENVKKIEPKTGAIGKSIIVTLEYNLKDEETRKTLKFLIKVVEEYTPEDNEESVNPDNSEDAVNPDDSEEPVTPNTPAITNETTNQDGTVNPDSPDDGTTNDGSEGDSSQDVKLDFIIKIQTGVNRVDMGWKENASNIEYSLHYEDATIELIHWTYN